MKILYARRLPPSLGLLHSHELLFSINSSESFISSAPALLSRISNGGHDKSHGRIWCQIRTITRKQLVMETLTTTMAALGLALLHASSMDFDGDTANMDVLSESNRATELTTYIPQYIPKQSLFSVLFTLQITFRALRLIPLLIDPSPPTNAKENSNGIQKQGIKQSLRALVSNPYTNSERTVRSSFE